MNNNLANHLRRWGLKVVESPGWENRGRPFTFKPEGVLCHHTASGKNSGNFASERVVTFGRPDLPGPLCTVLLGRDGTVKLIAGGYANHAGLGGPRAGIPKNMGNTYMFGIEAENDGVGEKWGAAQLNAYYRLAAALLVYTGSTNVQKVFGHKEWTSRKIDPTGLNMTVFRSRVKAAIAAGPSVPALSITKLKPGKRNEDVVKLKNALAKKGYFKLANRSTYYGKGLQDAVKAYQKAQGWSGSDADGVPGSQTLGKLGFAVKK